MEKILNDLQQGETPILLGKLPAETFMPRRHRKALDKSIPFRWASVGKNGVKLETIKTPTGISTTKSAVLRFFAALTDPAAAPSSARTPARRAREIAAAERELRSAGML